MTLFKENRQWAFLFPGIGVKPFGKECDFYAKYHDFIAPYLDKASEIAGIDLGRSLVEKTTFDNDQLSREVFAYAFSYAAYQVFCHHGLQTTIMAGHSLGIYAALAGSGAISFDQGLAITEKVHILGRQCCPQRKFGVVVIIGIEHREVIDIIDQNGYETVNLANLNNDCSGVYVGCQEETDKLLADADKRGAIKTIRLRIDIPFHNPLFMEDVSQQLKPFLEKLNWQKPSCPIVSALDHTLCSTVEDLIAMTSANPARPIHWPGVMKTLNHLGIESAIECGPGVSLSQHARFIDNAPRHYNLKNLRRRLDY